MKEIQKMIDQLRSQGVSEQAIRSLLDDTDDLEIKKKRLKRMISFKP